MKAQIKHQHDGRPLIALVGRPNVGKSTLFNRLLKSRRALMHDTEGVTRDRIYGEFELEGLAVRLVDTGGIVEAATRQKKDAITESLLEQTRFALKEADVVLVVVDCRQGITPGDILAAQWARQSGRAWWVVANKADTEQVALDAVAFFALGCNHVDAISAEHRRGIAALEERLLKILAPFADACATAADDDTSSSALDAPPPTFDDDFDEEPPLVVHRRPPGPMRVAVIGRPNAGKSSLVNAIVGQERLIASAVPGTTRDAIDIACTLDDEEFVFIDTPGIRRASRIHKRVEQLSVSLAVLSLARCDVAVLVLDATQRPSVQDKRIAALAHAKGVALVIVASKWDLIENELWAKKFPEALRYDLPFVDYAPIVKVSSPTQKGLPTLMRAIRVAFEATQCRIGTGALNRVFQKLIIAHPPPIRAGKRPAMYFVSQPMVAPPTFIIATRGATQLPVSYTRYLDRGFRKAYAFLGTPIWIKYRDHHQDKTKTLVGR